MMTTATEAGVEEKCRRPEFGSSCLEPGSYISGASLIHRLSWMVGEATTAASTAGPRSFVTVTWAGRGTMPSH